MCKFTDRLKNLTSQKTNLNIKLYIKIVLNTFILRELHWEKCNIADKSNKVAERVLDLIIVIMNASHVSYMWVLHQRTSK